MLKLLLNANLSPETAGFIREFFGFDVKCLLEEGVSHISDDDVTALALKEGRVIVTSDLDFGQIYHFNRKSELGVIVLRLSDQTVESVNMALQDFFSAHGDEKTLNSNLVVVEDSRYRWYKKENETEN